jgi:hypothetical protein
VTGPLRDSSDKQPKSSNSSIRSHREGPEDFSQSSVSSIAAADLGSSRLPEPSSSPPLDGPSWSTVQQPNGEVLLESAGQTTFELQVVDARTDPVPVSSGMLQRDRSRMNALAEAAATHGSGPQYQNPLEVMGIA